jgi:hypothetical protein
MNSRRNDSKGLIRAGHILEQKFSALTPQETPNVQPPAKPTEFTNAQLSLFQNVLCNTEEERERLSTPSTYGTVFCADKRRRRLLSLR